MTGLKYFQFKALLQSTGWMSPAFVGVDDAGSVRWLSAEKPADAVGIEYVDGYALPGFQNAHSHAFQYAMAGMAEKHPPNSDDDFWSWREAMYACALSMDPDQVQKVAAMLYAEMLRKGYTHVVEFHYLHHDKDGKPYANLAEMGFRLVAAAQMAGIKITLVPVFYQKGGFGKPPQLRQRRFISEKADHYFRLLEASARAIATYDGASLGFGVHSLRAVEPGDIAAVVSKGPNDIPFHLHVAEQLREVDDCVAHLKQRPVEWVLNNLPVDDRFHLVHCTHLNDDEVEQLAKSGAHAVLCPGTEGNLGDGIFRLSDFASRGGHWSIGTDSHISLNPLEDLRWLDYAQRLVTHRRNTFDDGASMLVNKTIWSGRSAMGVRERTFFKAGQPLDAVVFSGKSPTLLNDETSRLLSRIVYNCDSGDVYGTLVNGRWVVKGGMHRNAGVIADAFQRAVNAIDF